jgi:hypothetical protein
MIITYVCAVIDRRTDKELASYEIEIDPKYQYEAHARLDTAFAIITSILTKP